MKKSGVFDKDENKQVTNYVMSVVAVSGIIISTHPHESQHPRKQTLLMKVLKIIKMRVRRNPKN
jgi:hypothetical protein